MAMERHPIRFDQVLTYQVEQRKEDWQEPFSRLESYILEQGVYQNGPAFFAFEPSAENPSTGLFTYYLPVNAPVEPDQGSGFGYVEHFHSGDALTMRQAEQEPDFDAAFKKVQDHAAREGIVIGDRYYCVLLRLYDDVIINLVVPLEGGRPE